MTNLIRTTIDLPSETKRAIQYLAMDVAPNGVSVKKYIELVIIEHVKKQQGTKLP